MSSAPRRREAAAVAVAIAVHLALLAAPRFERPVETSAGTPAPIDGLDIELDAPAALDTAAGKPAAPGSPAPAGAPKAMGQAAPTEKARAPSPGAAAAKSATPTKAMRQERPPEPAAPSAVSEAPPRDAAPPSTPSSETPGKAPESAAAPADAAAGPPGAVAERPPAVHEEPPAVAERPPGDDYGGPPPGDGALAPGLGAPVWTLPGAIPSAAPPRPAPTAAPAARPVDRGIAGKVLSGTLHSKDRSVGIEIPAAGLVATTLANVVRASPAPLDARATFEVKLGEGGQVLGVRLVSASAGSGPTWDGVVDAAKGALAGRALQMGPRKEPVTVTVKVQSKVQFPSGSKKKPTPELVCAEEVLEQLQQVLEDPSLLGASGDPNAHVPADLDEERKRRFCIPLGIGVRGDLSDIGAHAVNVVSATFTVKRKGERVLPHEEILPIDTRVPWAPPDPKKIKKPAPPKKPKKKQNR